MPSDRPIWCLAGPTAAGKSATCAMLAKHLPIEIVNVDSATIYRGMDVGTAKPDAVERMQIRHHLLDILDPSESYSVGRFCQDAKDLIEAIQTRGNLPLLAGGTMMYFNALRKGLDDLPSANPGVRRDIEARAKTTGWPVLHQELMRVDPVTAGRLAPHDSQRIGRALEVHIITGKPLSSLIGTGSGSPALANLRIISLEPSDRSVLHHRIAQRFEQMLERGLVDEVARLFARGDLDASMASIRCVGYRQIWDLLAGKDSLETAREKAIAATRQLAKRQLTWLRAMSDRISVDCLNPDAPSRVLSIISQGV
ncbi:tRNA (adenosine(37)-N6)-dimethylallyltransferase MiaA [Orrella marina]|uniref:tRNA dimethylallyltransferase n=1 Tax=Orrella marina TaxID=2163011 RepID=A0A2R4XNK8_9BURK|nr:tRNA (adenosine(37)-N6)-dimethylallyltransferase MiaA [Orrella marina]AWB35289.1 tRNA (adenosine(37)-N6)-dimethylallyltransferase MiaA [Orrella marina]